MRRSFLTFLSILVSVSLIGCDGGDGRPGEISVSLTFVPSETPQPSDSPSPSSSGSPGKPGGKKDDKPRVVKVPGGADLTELPARAAAICDKGPPLRRACPTLVPVVKKVSYVIDSFGRPGGRFQVLEMAAGAPRGDFSRNDPPGVAHVVVEVGRPGFIIDLGEPVPASAPLDSLLGTARSGSQLLSPEKNWKWNQELVLAESFPGGGAHGDHLIYEWRRGGYTYRVSLHAWTPGVEAVRTLHAIVKSID